MRPLDLTALLAFTCKELDVLPAQLDARNVLLLTPVQSAKETACTLSVAFAFPDAVMESWLETKVAMIQIQTVEMVAQQFAK